MSSARSEPAGPVDLSARARQVEAMQVELLYQRANARLFAAVLCAGFLVFSFRGVAGAAAIGTWFALMLTVTAGRFLLVWAYRRDRAVSERVDYWRRAGGVVRAGRRQCCTAIRGARHG